MGDLRYLILAFLRQTLREIVGAVGDGVHRIANIRQAFKQTGNHEVNHDGAEQNQDHQRQGGGFQQGAHPGGGIIAVEGDNQLPLGAGNRGGGKGFGRVVELAFGALAALEDIQIDAADNIRKGFQGQGRVVGGDHRPVAVNQQPAAGRGRTDTAHVGDHAVHRYVTRQHPFQLAVLFHRHRKSDHQLFGAGIDIRRGDDGAIFFHRLLIPGTYGGIVVGRYAVRIGELRGFAGITHIDVNKPTRLRQLFEHRYRIVAQGDVLQGVDYRGFAVDPVTNRQAVAGAGAGKHVALRLLIILTRDLEINHGVQKERGDQTSDRRRNNTSAN